MAAVLADTHRTEETSTGQPNGTLALAVLRIGLALVLPYQVAMNKPWLYAGIDLPRRPILGAEILDLLPAGRLSLIGGSAALCLSAVAMILGWRTRAVGWIAFVLAFWILGVPQGIAGVTHYHHIVWLLPVVAAGASDARLSVHPDRRDVGQVAHALALARVAVGIAYLFPGLAKLASSTWLDPDHLGSLIVQKHLMRSFSPSMMPPDWMLQPMALGTLIFEIGFIFAVFTRWRVWAVLVAFAFHVGLGLTMGIWGVALMLVLPALALPQPTWPSGLPARRFAVASGLLVAAFVVGVAGETDGWPVAHYPKFDSPASPFTSRSLMAVTRDGERYLVADLLAPGLTQSRQEKLTTRHSLSDLETAVEAELGEPVSLEWVTPPSRP